MITMCMMSQCVLVNLTKCNAVVGNKTCPPHVLHSPNSGGIYPPDGAAHATISCFKIKKTKAEVPWLMAVLL
jgi:hypothetical protein